MMSHLKMKKRPSTDRERRREQQRRHRQREREGRRVYLVELDGAILAMLIRLGWLNDVAAGADQEVSRAVQLLLADVAKTSGP
jgi:hypothetical protein